MTVKNLNHPAVNLFATSSHLTQVCRNAAKHNKSLASCAAIHELSHSFSIVEGGIRTPALPKLVVSHADDDCRVLTDARMASIMSGAFHLLFTGPATHPDQVAQWMLRTKIRSENRLHVVKAENMEAAPVSKLLGRVCSAFAHDSIVDAYLCDEVLFVRGPKQRMLHVPVAFVSSLRNQPSDKLRNFEIDPDGSFIYWPHLDVHLGWNQFLQVVAPAEMHKAQQRSADFNRRYGAAIRKVREAMGILQAKIDGITDRQLRRIERGESRATSGALAKLANAHGLDVNVYMEKLAQTM